MPGTPPPCCAGRSLKLAPPVVTRVERYAGHCSCCGGTTLAPVPDGLEEGSPFGPSVVAMALYLRFTHAISVNKRRTGGLTQSR